MSVVKTVALFDWQGSALLPALRWAVSECVDHSWTECEASLKVTSWPRSKRLPLEEIFRGYRDEGIECIEVTLAQGASIYLERRPEACALVVASKRADLSRLDQMALALLRALGPAYGFGFSSDGTQDPVFVSLGISDGIPETEEEERAADEAGRWFSERLPMRHGATMRHRRGMLRDVFPLNFLMRTSLTRSSASPSKTGRNGVSALIALRKSKKVRSFGGFQMSRLKSLEQIFLLRVC